MLAALYVRLFSIRLLAPRFSFKNERVHFYTTHPLSASQPPIPPTNCLRIYANRKFNFFRCVKNPFSFMPTFASFARPPTLTSAKTHALSNVCVCVCVCVSPGSASIYVYLYKNSVPLNRAPIIIHLSTPGQKENYFIHFSGDGSAYTLFFIPHNTTVPSLLPLIFYPASLL